MNRCLIRGSNVYGIPGGWSLTHPALPGQRIAERSPEHAVAQLAALLRVNRIAATDDELWEYANNEWGKTLYASGLKERWMGDAPPDTPKAGTAPAPDTGPKLFRVILTPKETGPSLWGTLHLIPLVFSPAAWNAHIDLMTRLIEPGGFEPGCAKCAGHWREFRRANPPAHITTAAQAAEWGWRAHNAANSHAGNAQFAWREAAAKWGWDPAWEKTA